MKLAFLEMGARLSGADGLCPRALRRSGAVVLPIVVHMGRAPLSMRARYPFGVLNLLW